jgi:tetratricopeptide (TPR) repeat protein
MYLKTPKRYQGKGKRYLLNLRWLWLYIAFPILLVPLLLAWNARESLSGQVAVWAERNIKINLNPPTPTPTIPADELTLRFASYVQSGAMNNAISTLYSLTDLRPNDVALHMSLTRLIALRGDPDDSRRLAEALAAAQRTINANPESPEGWMMAAFALNNSGQPQTALAYILRARDFDAKNPLALAIQADIYLSLEKNDEAETLATEAIELAAAANPINVLALAIAHIVRGNIFALTDGEKAIAAYDEAWRAAKTDPTLPLGFVAQWIASFYLNRPDSDRAVEILTEASNRDKDDPINPYLLGRIYLNRGDPDRARTFLERCRDLDPDQVKCLRWLGTVLYRAQNYARAAELAQRAVDLGTKDAAAYLIAGLSYALLNRCNQAVPLLRQGITLDQNAALFTQFQDGLRQCRETNIPSAPPVATQAP